ncbi:MAG: hypothetical protein AAFZ38_03380 [Myxococcota bacterium]
MYAKALPKIGSILLVAGLMWPATNAVASTEDEAEGGYELWRPFDFHCLNAWPNVDLGGWLCNLSGGQRWVLIDTQSHNPVTWPSVNETKTVYMKNPGTNTCIYEAPSDGRDWLEVQACGYNYNNADTFDIVNDNGDSYILLNGNPNKRMDMGRHYVLVGANNRFMMHGVFNDPK